MTADLPKNSRHTCYFGCKVAGPLHHFPVPERDVERFETWKAVLENDAKEKGNSYIYNQLRLCNKHFENYYVLPSNRLTRNAIPTLCIKKDDIMSISESISTENSVDTDTCGTNLNGFQVLMDEAAIEITKFDIQQIYVPGWFKGLIISLSVSNHAEKYWCNKDKIKLYSCYFLSSMKK